MKYCTECLINPPSPRSRLGLYAECAHKRLMDQSNARAKRVYQKRKQSELSQVEIKETHSLVCTRAQPDQVERVREWFQELEEILTNHEKNCDDIGNWVKGSYPRVNGEWERILFGYETLVENVCDPTLSYLDFKPAIKWGMKKAVTIKNLLIIIKRMTDYCAGNSLNFQHEKFWDYVHELTVALSETEEGDDV
jgi:hypothetical protein